MILQRDFPDHADVFRTASVKGLIKNEKGEVLLLRRSSGSKNNAGLWDLPGGKVDPGEHLEAALRREVVEETGLSFRSPTFEAAQVHTFGKRALLYIYFSATVRGPEVRLSEEHTDYCWAPNVGSMSDLTPGLQKYIGEPVS